jgi:hypothetical protein
MKDKVGKMNGGFVWLFALGAIVLGIGSAWLTASMSNKISMAVYFGVFAAAGFLAILLTRSKTGVGVLAFFLAAAVSATVYFFIVSAVMADATYTMTSAVGASSGDAQQVGSLMGKAAGWFAAAFIFLDTLVAGIGGCLFGAKQRKRLLA